MQAANYVGAPVIAYGEVVATIDGDAYFSDRMVDEVDRDVIAAFAASLGPILERAILIEQLQFQQRVAEQLAQSASGVLGGLGGDIPLLESVSLASASGVGYEQLCARPCRGDGDFAKARSWQVSKPTSCRRSCRR